MKNPKGHLADRISPLGDIVDCVRRAWPEGIGRAGIAESLGISWQIADKHINKLVAEGILKQDNKSYFIDKDIASFLGIAIGRRNVKVVIVNFAFKPFSKEKLTKFHLEGLLEGEVTNAESATKEYIICYDTPTTIEEMSDLLNRIMGIVLESHEKYDLNLGGIGIAFTGAVESDKSIVTACHTISYLAGRSIDDLISGIYLDKLKQEDIPLVVDHNAKACLIHQREALYHAADPSHKVLAGKPNIAVVYMGTGISAGFSFNGKMYRGCKGYSGEIGHIPSPRFHVEDDDYALAQADLDRYLDCTCGRKGCFEDVLKKSVFFYNEKGIKAGKSNDDILSDERLKNLYEEERPRYECLKKYIGFLIGVLLNTLSPDVLIFAGRLFNLTQNLKNELKVCAGLNTLPYIGKSSAVIAGNTSPGTVAIGMAIEACFAACRQGDGEEIVWYPVIK